jgi:LTXXQ motif family protein
MPGVTRGARGPSDFARRNAGRSVTGGTPANLNRNALAPPAARQQGANPAAGTARNPRDRTAPPSTVGLGPSAAPRNLARGQQGARHAGILRNAALANLSPRDPASRALTRTTFRGRFARSGFARGFDRDGHHRHLGIVLGFAGPVFWPYAYDDFVDYTFWPSAYDTFWPYAYDDVFEGLYGGYAPEYGAVYATAGAPASDSALASGATARAGATAAQATAICAGQAQGLTDFPIERISQQVEPNQDQQALLDDLKAATAKAVAGLQSACPGDLPSTPTGRVTAMRERVEAMLQAVQIVRPALDKFYQSLTDEQKERFNALDDTNAGAGATADRRPTDVAQACDGRAAKVTNLPIASIEQSLRLSEAQNAGLRALDEASAKAAGLLAASCPTDRALTPPGRIAAMEQRLTAMLQAVDTVQPALAKFYGSLSDEQKARFDRLGGRPA